MWSGKGVRTEQQVSIDYVLQARQMFTDNIGQQEASLYTLCVQIFSYVQQLPRQLYCVVLSPHL